MIEGELSDLGNAMPKRKGREDIRWVNHEMLGKRAVVSLMVSAHRINQVSQEAPACCMGGSASGFASASVSLVRAGVEGSLETCSLMSMVMSALASS